MSAFSHAAATRRIGQFHRLHRTALAVAIALAPWALHAQSTQPGAGDPSAEARTDTGTASTLPPVRIDASGARDAGYAAKRSNSATGFDQSLRDTPQSISILTRTQLADFALTNVNQALDQATGIQVERVETDRTYYTARGFDVTNFQFDGIGMPFTNGSQWGDLDTAIFERVEVLRGANGLLSPTGNPSATINYVRKRPGDAFHAGAELTLGSWNDRRVQAEMSGPLNAAKTVRGQLIVVREAKDSYLDRYHTDKTLVDGALEIDLSRDTELRLAYTQQNNDADSPLWGALPLHYTDGTPTDYDVSTSTSTDWAYWNNTDKRANATLLQRLGGDWTAQASVLYREMHSDSELFYIYGTPDRATGLGLYAYPSAFVGDYTQSMADLRVSGPVQLAGRKHELLFGVSSARERARERSDYGQGIGTALPDLATWNGAYPKPSFDASTDGSHFDTRRSSVYAAAKLALLDALKLTVGANATTIDSAGENYRVAHAYDKHAFTPYVGAVWTIDERVSAYSSVTRIFNPQTEVDVNHQVLDPIEGRNLEAGLKTAWLDDRLNLNAAVFRATQNNTAEAAGSFSNFQTYYRGVNATSTGYELELVGRLADGWDINAGYTQFRLKGEDGQDARTYVPRRTLHVSTGYRLPTLPALKVGAALRYQSDIRTTDGDAVIRQDAYALVDLMLRYTIDQHWSLALNANNVTNKKYINSLYWTQGYYGAPRNVSATLSWTY